MSVTTDHDRDAALEWASTFRRRRSELRRDMACGMRSLGDVLDSADRGDDGLVRLLFVLESLPGAGKVATRRHLARLGLAGNRAIRELTASQRALLLREFPLDAATSSATSP